MDPNTVFSRSLPQPALTLSEVLGCIPSDTDYEPDVSEVQGYNDNSSVVSSVMDPNFHRKQNAKVEIIEQPQSKALRFRYICEGRSAGSIPGQHSTPDNKTFPAIQVKNYKGPAVVVVSCVTVDPPYRVHPHNLVGKENCKKGICTMNINNESMQCVFSNLGIQCVKKKEVAEKLKEREEMRVDPFGQGFTHAQHAQSIDLNAVRLCFQVFLEGSTQGQYTHILDPVVSIPIYDKKATSDLNICKLSDCSSLVTGGKEIILLCEKVTKEDIKVSFFELDDKGQEVWRKEGEFQPSDVHKQVAISFKTPKYRTLEVDSPVQVYIELIRPSDGLRSERRVFSYLPLDSGRPFTSFKRLKNNYGLFQRILGLESPNVGADVGEETLRRKMPQSPKSPGMFEIMSFDDVKPKPPPADLKIPSPQPGIQILSQPRATTSPALLKQKSGVPLAGAAVTAAAPTRQTSSPPLLLSPDQSVDDIRQRLTATLKDRKAGELSPKPMAPSMLRPSPFWSDDTSVYSDADILDDVLSQGSVNDLLSAVGDGFAVYEDITELPDPSNNNELQPDAVYGDASYASCYSNLEFVMGQAKAASTAAGSTQSLTIFGDSSQVKFGMPALPPKKNPRGSLLQLEEDDPGIYDTPSARPIHPNKASLLLERGFCTGNSTAEGGTSTVNIGANRSVDNVLYYDPGGNKQSDVPTDTDTIDMWDDSSSVTQDGAGGKIPRTVLDLFV